MPFHTFKEVRVDKNDNFAALCGFKSAQQQRQANSVTKNTDSDDNADIVSIAKQLVTNHTKQLFATCLLDERLIRL